MICRYAVLGIPPARAAQLHSEAAQEAATTEGCMNCIKRRKMLRQALDEFQEVQEELREVQEELRQALDEFQDVQQEGMKLQQHLQEVKSQIQAFSNASTVIRKTGIKKSKCHKKFKLGKFVSREFNLNSARQHLDLLLFPAKPIRLGDSSP